MRIVRFALRSVGVFALAACSGFTEPGPRTVVITPLVPELTGVVGELTESPPLVVVTDTSDKPIRGVIVEFRTLNPQHGLISAALDTTNAMGIASAGTWTLGPRTGVQQVGAFVPSYGRVTTLTAVARAGPVTSLGAATLLKQSVLTGRHPLAPSVRALDRYNNNVSGVGVEFTTGTSGGSLGAVSTITNSQGIASAVTWNVPSAGGTYSVTASTGAMLLNFTAQRVDSAGLVWFALDSVLTGTKTFAPSEWNIRAARLGVTPFDPCLCANLEGSYFEISDYTAGLTLHSELSGDFRIIDSKISMQFVDTVKVTATSVQLKRIDSYYGIVVTWLYKRKQ